MAEALTPYSPGKAHTDWWDPKGTEPHKAMWDTVEFLRGCDKNRQAKLLRMARHYANTAVSGLGPGQYYRSGSEPHDDLSLNVLRNMVDAVQARIAKNRPKASVLTDGGDFGLQQRAKRLEHFLFGLFHRSGLYQIAPNIFRDAAIFGTGVLKVQVEGETSIGVERVYPWELLVDPVEAYHGMPRSMFHCRLIDRQVLKAMYPKREKLVDDAKRATDDHMGADRLADQIMVAEGWRLPNSRESEDGRHVVAIEGGILNNNGKGRAWKHPRYPFVNLNWADPMIGYWGTGLVEEGEGLQREINELLKKIQSAMYHMSVPILACEEGSKVEAQYDNAIEGVIVRVGRNERDPKWFMPSAVAPELFAQLDRLYERSFQVLGVSQLAAQSQKPAGLESGRALNVFNDIETERFIIRGQAFEHFFMQTAQCMLDAAQRIEERGKTVEVQARRRRGRQTFLEPLKFSDVSLHEQAFEMKVFPASSLPNSPAGRIQAVESFVRSGLLDPEDALPLLDFPDIDAVVSRKLAPYNLVLDIIERMEEEQEYIQPEPFLDLQLGIKLMQSARLDAKLRRAPQEVLQLMQDWMDDAHQMLGGAEQALTAQQPQPGPGAPAAAPAQPPGVAPAPAPAQGIPEAAE